MSAEDDRKKLPEYTRNLPVSTSAEAHRCGPGCFIDEDPIRKAEIKVQIERAFADVPYPGDDKVPQRDAWATEYDVDFRGRHWSELTSQELWLQDLPMLEVEALQYYLPAYLMAALDDLHQSLTPFVLYHLCPEPEKPDQDRFEAYRRQRFSIFTSAQRASIRAFLEYMRDHTGDNLDTGGKMMIQAMEMYWNP